MEKPSMEKYGYQSSTSFDEESGWMFEGGEDAYYEALRIWNIMKENGLGDEDMINDITYPHEL